MKTTSVNRLMSGVALAVLLSGSAVLAQTSTGQTIQTQQGTQAQTDTKTKAKQQGQVQTDTKTKKQGQAQTDTKTKQQGQAETDTKTKKQGQAQTDTKTKQQTTQKTTVKINTEQRTKIKQKIKLVNVEPVTSVNFGVSIGTVVPSTVVLHTVPTEIVEVVPDYSGYRFFLLPDGRIVIVEPSTLRIVLII